MYGLVLPRNFLGFKFFSFCFSILDVSILSLLDRLSDEKCWNDFYEYKSSLACKKSFLGELRAFIDNKSYLAVCEEIRNEISFPLPEKAVISKLDTEKKRIVYSYPMAENTVLKLLTHLMLRKYDKAFSTCLYSFRPSKTAKDAVRRFISVKDISEKCSYKVDISNYFNSVPVDRLLPMLQRILSDDPKLYRFLSSLLKEPYVADSGRLIKEQKGIMAGTPLSAFYANIYLAELDKYFEDSGILYARYSDDIIVFENSAEKLREHAEYIKHYLCRAGLAINKDKECFQEADDGWTFLGFTYFNGVIDISDMTVEKLKKKMRRKSRALMRWRKRNNISGEQAAKAFIRIFNRKLFEGGGDNDLTWALWFFSVINSDKRLRDIDRYAQEQIRFLVSGTHKKSRFNVRYDEMKRLGYKSLVHEYYVFRKNGIK